MECESPPLFIYLFGGEVGVGVGCGGVKKKKRGNPKVNEFDKSISSRPDFHINTLLMVCACGASIHIIGGWGGGGFIIISRRLLGAHIGPPFDS